MLSVNKVRLLLRIDESEISDEELQEYIEYFIQTTLSRIGLPAQKDNTIL